MSESNNPKPTPPWFSLSNQVIGFCIGMAVCAAVMFYVPKNYPKITEILHGAYYMAFGAALLIFIVIVGFKPYVQRFILNRAPNKVRGVIEDMQNVSDHVAIQLLDLLPTPPSEDIKTRAKAILPGITNLLIWARLRNWWWQWILGIFVAIGGLMGTILLMNQNELLEAQNVKIDSQTILMQKQTELAQRQMSLEEASRRSALVVLMSNIMDKVDREIENQQKGLSQSQKEKRKYKLSQSLIGQIAALSHSFKPYRYMEGDTLIVKPLSPERGQLLITLTLLPLDTVTLRKVYKAATFVNADLQNAVLADAYLSSANLSSANLSRANLSSANLSWADLGEANLSGANLSEANLNITYLGRANLSRADLSRADLRWTSFNEANLRWTDFNEANLSSADLSSADLSRDDLGDTIFIKGEPLTIYQASVAKSLFESIGIPDSIKTELMKTHPALFEDPYPLKLN